MPLTKPPAQNGFISTLNKTGFMTVGLDRYSEQFVKFASERCQTTPALEIGAAYGVATLPALAQGARMIANDLDPRHLEILASEAGRPSGGAHERLTLAAGAFPNDLNFAPQSLGAILACRVFHFFDPAVLVDSLKVARTWLAPWGRFFAVVETPYLRNVQGFHAEFERRKKSGDPWPGRVEDFSIIDPVRGAHLPPLMHFMDRDGLSRAFREAGYSVIECEEFARPEFPPDLQWDGRESVGIIASSLSIAP